MFINKILNNELMITRIHFYSSFVMIYQKIHNIKIKQKFQFIESNTKRKKIKVYSKMSLNRSNNSEIF